MALHVLPAAAIAGEIAEISGVREAMRWFTREKQWVNEIHLQLCRIPAPTFLEQERAEWFAAQMKALGWHARIDRAGNVLSTLEAEPGGNLLALSAHLDTVLAPRARDDVSVDRDGDFRGPGVSDNGAGLAALLALARSIKSAQNVDFTDSWNRLLLIANVGEEGEGDLCGIRHICRQPELIARIGAFIVLDGAATDHITVQGLGSRRFEVAFSGPGGHSWSDFGVGNPVHALSRAIAQFVDENPLDPRTTPKISVNVGVIEGGAGVNAIPAAARAKIDIRSESNERIENLVASLQAAVAQSEEIENGKVTGGASSKVSVRIREIGNRPAAGTPAGAPLVQALKAVDAHLGIRARFDCASTDANIPMSLGIPAVSIGAGGKGGGAHTTAEWYRPNGRDLGLKRILLASAVLLRSGFAAADDSAE